MGEPIDRRRRWRRRRRRPADRPTPRRAGTGSRGSGEAMHGQARQQREGGGELGSLCAQHLIRVHRRPPPRRWPCRDGRRARPAAPTRRAPRRRLRRAACRDRGSAACRARRRARDGRLPPSNGQPGHDRGRPGAARASGAAAAVATKPSSSTGMRCAGGRRASRRGWRRARGRRSAMAACKRVGVCVLVALEPCVDRLALSRQAGIVEAGAAPGPALAAAAEQRRGKRRGRGGVADAHLAEADEIGVWRHRVEAGRHRLDELGLAHGLALR